MTMACHEAGHAIVAWFTPDADPLHKITIIPRGRAMGHTQQLPTQDRHAYSSIYLSNRLAILMGGRAAEEVLLQQISTGAEGDLVQVIDIATNMVCKWGMSEKVGPLAYIRGDQGFLGGHSSQGNLSGETAHLIDNEIKSLVEEGHRTARDILEREKEFLMNLTEALLAAETIDREEMQIIHDCTRKKQGEQKDACKLQELHES
jgi:cell division protease FtsH